MSSLSSVVSNLVRASMGSTVSNTVTDEDLDRHVAELILKEAKQKAERYGLHGMRAYLPNSGLPESNAPKTNKRFLSSIIRSTDDHNKVILRAQALAAQEIKKEREEAERRERRLRAEEAVAAERMRRLMGGPSRRCDLDSWDWRERRDYDRKRQERSWSEDEDDYRHDDRDRRRSRRSSRHRHNSRRIRRRRSRSPTRRKRSPSPSSTARESSHSGKRATALDDLRNDRSDSHRKILRSQSPPDLPSNDTKSNSAPRRRHKSKHKIEDDNTFQARHSRTPRSESPSPSLKHQSDPHACSSHIPISPPSHSRSPSPQPAVPQLPSKMDKYFEASYDPRLDVASLSAPSIPTSGLIDNAQFEGWDAMLELIRVRREDKVEKKRMERLGLTKDNLKDRKKYIGDATGVADRWSDVGVDVMDIEYKKRGAVREWDMGKEGF